MSAPGDIGCKQLFAYPELVRELLHAAMPQACPPGARLQRCNGSYVSATGRQRHSDMVWRLQCVPDPPLYLMLEFQSHPDHWMALRMHVYAGLLCQDLLRQQRLRHQKLPMLLPLVLYTGSAAWTAPTDLKALHDALQPCLAKLQPEQTYLLVDQSSLRGTPAGERSVLASLLEFEQAADDLDLLFALQHISDWLAAQRSKELQQFVRDWVIRRLRNEFQDLLIPPEITLLEVHAMFNHRFSTPEELWKFQAEQRGLKQGIEKGREIGQEIGREIGQEIGQEIGRKIGIELGALAERKRFVLRLVQRVGELPDAARVVEEADGAQLEAWIDELLDGQVPAALK